MGGGQPDVKKVARRLCQSGSESGTAARMKTLTPDVTNHRERTVGTGAGQKETLEPALYRRRLAPRHRVTRPRP